tara:strand:+ start:2196 stop:3911 length:1716 start_codon:yes stop_codon:yes gene_type:complete
MKHFINGVEVTPRNLLNIGLQSDFTDRPEYLEVDADKLVLPREAVAIIQQHLGTYGPFEGIPYTMITDSGISLEYYIDLQEDTIFRDFEIEVKIKRRFAKDNFFERADSITFELMASKGVNFDYFDVPYVIIQDNQVETAIGLAISIYVVTKDVIDQIIALSTTITNIIDSVTPEVGAGVTTDPAEIATLIVKAILQLAVVALLLVALIKLVQQLFELIFPKVRNFNGIKVKRLLEQACAHLGYSFSSSLLDGISGLTIVPVPLVKEKESFWDFIQNDLNFAFNKGYPSASDSTPTLGALLTALENQFNARTKVLNGNVEFEIRNYWQDLSSNQIIPALNLQADRQSEYRYNTEDIWKRTYIHYQVDYSDLFTIDFYDPNDAEYSTESVNVANPDLVSIRGLNEVSIPFALGGRKSGLNWLEKLAKGFFELVDGIINTFGGNGNYAAQIEGRIGVMQVSQQFFSQTKMLYTIGGKQPSNYPDLISAGIIYQNYHQINEIAVNDFKVFINVPIRMNAEEFVTLLNNNYAEIDGVICEILTIQYKDEESMALISYKQPFDWANGKTQVITINN